MKPLLGFLSGLVWGGAIGFAAAILLAPSSGDDLRARLQEKWAQVKEEAEQASAARQAELENELARMQRGENVPHLSGNGLRA